MVKITIESDNEKIITYSNVMNLYIEEEKCNVYDETIFTYTTIEFTRREEVE